MTNHRSPYLIALIVLVGVSLACASTETSTERVLAPNALEATEAPTDEPGGELTRFTDENDYLEIEVPSDWEHTQKVDEENDNWYWDVFTSPDGYARVESIVYDDGEPFVGTSSGKTALQWLHQNYSETGEEGDIRISDDSMQKDGSERLTWESKGGDYSGISFVEIRKPTAMLMFTVVWDNEYEDEYADLLNAVIESYHVP